MSKVLTIFVTIALLLGAVYGVCNLVGITGPDIKGWGYRQIVKIIDQKEIDAKTAENTVKEFGSMVHGLKRTHSRIIRHLQSLIEKETRAQHAVDVVESELRFMKGKLGKGEPIHYPDGTVLTPEEVELRSIARGEELVGARECLQVITSERQYFDKLQKQHAKNLRLAPIHRQILKVRLATLNQKLRMYRDRKKWLDDSNAGDDAYTALYNEAKKAIGEAEESLGDAFGTVDTEFKPLLRNSSSAKISSSGAATDRALARIDALLTGK